MYFIVTNFIFKAKFSFIDKSSLKWFHSHTWKFSWPLKPQNCTWIIVMDRINLKCIILLVCVVKVHSSAGPLFIQG